MTASPSPGRTAAVLVAAGQGLRLGAGRPKALVSVVGRPLFLYAFAALDESPQVDLVVIAGPPEDCAHMEFLTRGRALVVEGGETRQESVRNALAVLPDDIDVVLVHDAARALAPVSLVDAVATAVRAGADAVIPALPVVDTIKRVTTGGGGTEVVTETLDRSSLRAVQTPQGFRRTALVAAHEASAGSVTDDASVIEASGGTVIVVPGSPEAFKITSPLDLLLAEALVVRRTADGVDD